MSDETINQEKRAFFRMRIPGKVIIKPFNSDQPLQGKCINISANGLLFESATALNVNSEVEIEVYSADINVQPLITNALVIRCQLIADSSCYEIALKMDLPQSNKPIQ
ncbi:PilZ domain-containing protein [Pelagibaculum spongiae]|uniref:PilZ domain-containing protein n=1 Tax=Pelagibaculum spongiae TaxID=2080658 RepID=A0A2V1GRM2_9GAMM|nr:PilZ domain-containing protein [Pelagibaculum spongiae]PVZ64314.1 hypothetical protein DC094_19815 [Pelagibaculum spongiae]